MEAARILSYVNQLRTAALRVSIAGTPREEIEVHLPGQTWAACSTGKKCIFGPQGGAAIAIDLEADAERDVYGNTWTYFDYTDAATVPDIGTADPDIILSRLMKIGPRGQLLCQAINDLLGIEGIPEVTAGNNGLGTFPAAPGQATACIKHFASHYAFYTTILEF